jgi:carboxyl-terminal processing protease
MGGIVGFGAVVSTRTVHAAAPVAQSQVASVDDLTSEAFKALRQSQFDRVNELLSKAATLANNGVVSRWADWTNQFDTQWQGTQSERRQQYEKFVGDVHKLQAAGKESYAIDYVRDAYVRADDKKAFRDQSWVDQIVKNSVAQVQTCEAKEQWLKCLRIYSALGSLEPANPLWKDKLKLTLRHVRLIALYAPDELKVLQEAESKDHDGVDALLHPATQPTTALSSTKPLKDDGEDNFKVDWHDQLKGIRMEMLSDALEDARENYYRDVALKDMLTGGLGGVRALATTAGLEKTFPKLGDEATRQEFLAKLDALSSKAKDSLGTNESTDIRRTLSQLRMANIDTIDLPEEVIVNEFADGAFGVLDPFSSMIWPSDMEEFNKATQGEFSGVGIQIQSDDDGSLKVVSPLEDSPAYHARIKAGDVIIGINGKNAKGISITQAVKNITGPAGTSVTLTVRSPDNSSREVPLIRETIKVPSIKGWSHKPGGGWDYIVDPEQHIAYIRLTQFTKTTGEELNKAMDDLQAQHVNALILDLRYNPGGLLTAAIEVCEKFVDKGVIVSTHPDRDTPNRPTMARANGSGASTIPLVVLVNQYSASASEIVSGCLKDNKRALIVGERTFGKGSVQMLFPLVDREAFLKLTTSHYYLPSGRCIHREENSTEWGVDPDVSVEVTPEQMRIASDARQELDVLHDKITIKESATAPTTQPKDPLSVDPQLSAALLLLRLQLNGAQI